ncbi:MAG: disulfide bond formation protein B [Pararhizobium sp.]
MTLASPADGRQTIAAAALFLAVAMAAVVGVALALQYLGGYMPCELCLKERIPYYVGVPLMVVAAANAASGGPSALTRGLLALGGLLMLVGGAISVYHAGVEWHFWQGPSSCTGSGDGGADASTLLSDLNAVKPPQCDVAALRVLGLSLAGWNVVASAVLAAIALGVAFRRPRLG